MTHDLGAGGKDKARACLVDDAGALYIAGDAMIDPFSSNWAQSDLGLVKVNPDGSHAWSTTFDFFSMEQTEVVDMAWSPGSSELVVAVRSRYPGGWQPNVVWMSPTTGGIVGLHLNQVEDTYTRAMAIDPTGCVLITGTTLSGSNRMFVRKISPSGQILWYRQYHGATSGTPGGDNGYAIESLPNGDIVVAGQFKAANWTDLAVLRLDPDGIPLWTQTIDGGLNAHDAAFHVWSTGDKVFVGGRGNIGLNAGWLIAQLDAASGAVDWSRTVDGPGFLDETVTCLAVDARGILWVAGEYANAGADLDIGVQRYSSSGALLSSTVWAPAGGVSHDTPVKLLLGSEGQAWIVGHSRRANSALDELQVLQFDRAGALNWARSFSSPGTSMDRAADAVLMPGSRLLVVGETDTAEVDFDYLSMAIDLSESPHSYCTSKQNSLGCEPSMGFTGAPSSSQSSGFVVSCERLLNQRNGHVLYGASGPASVPFLGGFLCVSSPLRRLPPQNSGGSPPPMNDCSGSFAIDMNVLAAGGTDPALATPGAEIHCQVWSRDPSASHSASLSNGLAYTVLP